VVRNCASKISTSTDIPFIIVKGGDQPSGLEKIIGPMDISKESLRV